MRRALHQVLTTVAVGGAHRRFGICQDCAHFGRETYGNLPSTGPLAAKCLLLGVSIQSADAGLLCVHFQIAMANTMNEFITAICRNEA